MCLGFRPLEQDVSFIVGEPVLQCNYVLHSPLQHYSTTACSPHYTRNTLCYNLSVAILACITTLTKHAVHCSGLGSPLSERAARSASFPPEPRETARSEVTTRAKRCAHARCKKMHVAMCIVRACCAYC